MKRIAFDASYKSGVIDYAVQRSVRDCHSCTFAVELVFLGFDAVGSLKVV